MTIFTTGSGLTETLKTVLRPDAIGRGVTGKLALLLLSTTRAVA